MLPTFLTLDPPLNNINASYFYAIFFNIMSRRGIFTSLIYLHAKYLSYDKLLSHFTLIHPHASIKFFARILLRLYPIELIFVQDYILSLQSLLTPLSFQAYISYANLL